MVASQSPIRDKTRRNMIQTKYNPIPNRFRDQVVVVTGSANGIGRACALRFAQEGANIAGLDIDTIANEQMAVECTALGVTARAFTVDVKEKKAITAAFEAIQDQWGHVDILVTSAGIYSGSPLPEVSLTQWQTLLQTNLTGTFLCNQAVAPMMQARKSGSIINIASMAGKTSFPATAEYSASKSGMIGLTRSVAMELAPHGITANVICPGNTVTHMLTHDVAQTVAPAVGMTPETWLEMRQKDCPMGRFAQPWEIAGVAAFLASPDARYITGQAIEVDGGMVLS